MNRRNPSRLLVLTVLLAGCGKSNLRETAPNGLCRVEKMVSTTQSSTSTHTEQTTYAYDSGGHLTKKTVASETKYTSGPGTQTFDVTDTYAYDADGFLTTHETRVQERSPQPNGSTLTDDRSTTRTYTYTNGRVTGYATRLVSKSGTTTLAGTYTYDDTGDLTARTETQGTFERTWTYRKGLLTDYVEKSGTDAYRPYVLQDGLVTRQTIRGTPVYVAVMTYDAQQRQTKHEEFNDGKPTRYTTRTFGDVQPAEAILPLFKGFPTLRPEFGQPGVLATEDQYFINATTGATQHFRTDAFEHQKNGRGLVARSQQNTQFLNPQTLPQRVTTIQTYTYADCD
jgi:hypothetical protein